MQTCSAVGHPRVLRTLGLVTAILLFVTAGAGRPGPASAQRIVVEDFSYEGAVPTKWRILNRREESAEPLPSVVTRDEDYVEVVTLNGQRVLRVYTRDETVQVARINGDAGFDWNTREHPQLSWRWRAHRLPEGARESRNSRNDTGGALYVSFNCNDWLRRPCVIKYTYSSSLPVGSTARYGMLRVLVVSSAQQGIGSWRTIERNVRQDYRNLFGKEAPSRPLFIMVWGDSDTTHGVSDVYFDSIVISRPE